MKIYRIYIYMIVKDLIEKLQTLDPVATGVIYSSNFEFNGALVSASFVNQYNNIINL